MRSSGERGFTLVEVLVAFLIAATALGSIFSLLGTSTRGTAGLEARMLAAIEARGLLARLGPDLSLAPGEQEGEIEGGGRWRITIDEANSAEDTDRRGRSRDARSDSGYVLLDVMVAVERSDGGEARLRTFRLVGASR